MPPTFGNGKVCYPEIPAVDIGQSAAFYGHYFYGSPWGMSVRMNAFIVTEATTAAALLGWIVWDLSRNKKHPTAHSAILESGR